MPPREWVLSCGIHDRYTELHRFDHVSLEESLVRIEAPPGWTLREDTSDRDIFTAVVTQDEYGLRGMWFANTDVVLDIGAHTGSFALAAFDRGCRRIGCHEPHPANYQLLVDNLTVLNRMGMDPMPKRFAVLGSVSAAEPSVLVSPHGAFQTGSHSLLADSRWEGVVVSVETFDRVVRGICAYWMEDRIRLLKLDCEGAEWGILAHGSPTVFSNVQEIIGEYHENYAPSGCNRSWLASRLKELGFGDIRIDEPRHGGWGFFGAKRD